MSNPMLHSLISWMVTLIVPLALLLTVLRLLLTPIFVQVEYRTPGFPEDEYGFTQAERIHYGGIALDYLKNNEGIDFLGDLTFEDGSPLYKDSELSHMVDVKNLVKLGLNVWMGLMLALTALGVWAWRGGWLRDYGLMLASGGKLALFLIAAALVYLAFNFNQLFIQFHQMFFEGDSWLFLFSDTLIRLFPIRFWRDAFATLFVLTLAGAGALWYFLDWRVIRRG
jgi:integral membrane protein (TIGR01906 family)